MLMLPKTFTNETLDAVASYRCFHMLARYGQAKPCKRLAAILPEYDKIFITGAPCIGEHTVVILAPGQAAATGKTPAAGGNVNALFDDGSDSQALTTLGAAVVQDFAPVTGAHTRTEAVSTFAFNLAGLKSSFHGRFRVRSNCQIYRRLLASEKAARVLF